MIEVPPSCALLGGFAIGAPVALLWQITRTLVYAGCARVGDGGVLKTARRISQVGVAGWPVTGRRRRAFSTLLRRPGLRASNGGVLVT